MIEVKSSGSFKNTEKFLAAMRKSDFLALLDKYGKQGVAALATAAPVDTGLLASSWEYEVYSKKGFHGIVWSNTNVENGLQVAILVQYGHATRDGGWVEGIDYVNPAIQPLFDKIAQDVWEEVKRA